MLVEGAVGVAFGESIQKSSADSPPVPVRIERYSGNIEAWQLFELSIRPSHQSEIGINFHAFAQGVGMDHASDLTIGSGHGAVFEGIVLPGRGETPRAHVEHGLISFDQTQPHVVGNSAGGHAVKLGDLHAALGSSGKYVGRCTHSILKVHVDPPVLLALVLDLADADPANFSN